MVELRRCIENGIENLLLIKNKTKQSPIQWSRSQAMHEFWDIIWTP